MSEGITFLSAEELKAIRQKIDSIYDSMGERDYMTSLAMIFLFEEYVKLKDECILMQAMLGANKGGSEPEKNVAVASEKTWNPRADYQLDDSWYTLPGMPNIRPILYVAGE